MDSVVDSIYEAIRELKPDSPLPPPPRIEVQAPEAPPPPALRLPPRITVQASPPPALRLPPKVAFILIPLALLILTLIGILLLKWVGSSNLLFIGQMLLLIIALCGIPTLVGFFVKPEKHMVSFAVESSLFSGVLIGFGIWLFGRSAVGVWIAYAVVLILLIEAGGHIVQWHKDMVLRRLSTGPSFKSIQEDAEHIEKMFHHEALLYASVPLGLIIGTLVGLIQHETVLAIILLCFQIVLLLASLVLLYFLLFGFQRMCNPIFKTAPVIAPQVALKKRSGFLLRMFEILVPSPPKSISTVEDPKQKDLDLACDASNLRKIYKYDMLHNAILLVILPSAIISMWRITIDIRWLISLLLTATLLFSEIPYALGQYFLHQKVLERYTGSAHAEMSQKLQEYTPLFPPLPILAALMTAGTIGGFLFFLLNLFVQGALGPPK